VTPPAASDRLALTGLARASIAAALQLRAGPAPDSPILDERHGAFVTLTLRERLRGCVGQIRSDEPLRALLPEMARAAAFDDPRFPPLTVAEFKIVLIEVSLLTRPVRVASPDEVVVGTHGVIVSARGRRGLLLPQVAIEWNWTREELLENACAKASLPRDAWRKPATRVDTFTARVYAEGED
jgi:AmmeMemoRadiSam system protein A